MAKKQEKSAIETSEVAFIRAGAVLAKAWIDELEVQAVAGMQTDVVADHAKEVIDAIHLSKQRMVG